MMFRIRSMTFVYLSVLALATSAFAYEPLRNRAGLNRPKAETLVQVRTAKVVLADYALLRKDFPEIRMMDAARIDEWLLSKTAYISLPQAAQSVVNTPIDVGSATVSALRPRDYGRAIVFPVGRGSFIDAKGTGGLAPAPGSHSDGLATLGEATREFVYEKLVSTILKHSGTARETLGHYAVIDFGFDVIHADGKTDPAGVILRQAHQRAPGRSSTFNDAQALEVELLLRRYGVTTTGAYRAGAEHELINVQGTADGALLDFGAYLTVDEFRRPARNFFSNSFILNPGQIQFIQPDPRYRVPLDTWGFAVSGLDDPKFDNPWVWSHELARDFRRGAATRGAFGIHFDNLVGSYQRNLLRLGGAARPSAFEALVRGLRQVH